MVHPSDRRRWQPWWTSLIAIFLLLLGGVACDPLPTPDQGPWEESFEDADGWQLSSDMNADVEVAEGRLFIHIMLPGQLAWAKSQRAFKDFDLSVEATQLEGPNDNEYGILVRMEGDDRFYAFSISGDGYVRAALFEEGTWKILGSDWSPTEAIEQGAATNLLQLKVRGSDFTFMVNGQEVLQVTDDTLDRGQVGLYAGAFDTAGVQVAFDNLQIVPAP
ncbi:MAG: family 16 glycoside hydrolase [Anaerolineae bacterium]